MADTIKITAEARDRAGKGAARAARRAGMIPGVIYGDNKPPVLFNVNAQSPLKILRDPAALTHIYDIEIGSGNLRGTARFCDAAAEDAHVVIITDANVDDLYTEG